MKRKLITSLIALSVFTVGCTTSEGKDTSVEEVIIDETVQETLENTKKDTEEGTNLTKKLHQRFSQHHIEFMTSYAFQSDEYTYNLVKENIEKLGLSDDSDDIVWIMYYANVFYEASGRDSLTEPDHELLATTLSELYNMYPQLDEEEYKILQFQYLKSLGSLFIIDNKTEVTKDVPGQEATTEKPVAEECGYHDYNQYEIGYEIGFNLTYNDNLGESDVYGIANERAYYMCPSCIENKMAGVAKGIIDAKKSIVEFEDSHVYYDDGSQGTPDALIGDHSKCNWSDNCAGGECGATGN